MRYSVSWSRLGGGAVTALSALIAFGCGREGPAEPQDPLAARAKTSSIVVSQTDPATGVQGATDLQVRITGAGYARGAQADWERNGVPDPKITVTSTRLVSATEVVATISIAADADLASYDVAVVSGGKKGIGTELFAVTEADPTATWFIPVSDPTLGFQADRMDTSFSVGGGPTIGYGRYRDGECGVSTRIYSTPTGSSTGGCDDHDELVREERVQPALHPAVSRSRDGDAPQFQ